VRLAVNKKRVVTGRIPVLVLLPITSTAPSAGGFTQLADYGSRTVYEGPSAAAASVIASLRGEGYDAAIAADIERVQFHDFSINPDTGQVTPPVDTTYTPTGSDGLFILVLKSYPTSDWLDDLAVLKVRVLQELPPAAYVVRASRTVAAGPLAARRYVRKVVPLLPSIKKVLFAQGGPPSPFRRVSIEAVEEVPADSIRAHLEALSNETVTSHMEDRVVRYVASISDLDSDVLSRFENVYSISPISQVSPSSERQGVLISQPAIDGSGRLSLPGSNPGYGLFLFNHGIDFSNTKIGILDTGLNDGTVIPPDYPGVVLPLLSEPSWGLPAYDRDLHGTLTTSVITGYSGPGQRADGQGYRYTLGLAPTVHVVVDKYLQCGGRENFPRALDLSLAPLGVNVVNLSWNSAASPDGCTYTPDSQTVDSRTRSNNWLFTISAGNSPQGTPACPYIRSPATAKNGITAGATMGFVPDGDNDPLHGDTCNWNGLPADTDARNIPSFSTYRNPAGLIKPDLVAPATRVTGPVGTYTPRCSAGVAMCNDLLVTLDGVTYGFSAGTSFAAPAIAGAAAVVRSWYSNVQGGSSSPAMTKAMLINGARDLGPFPGVAGAKILDENTLNPNGSIGNIPDDRQGWGMLNLSRLLGPAAGYYFYDQGVKLLSASGLWQKYLYIVNGSRDTHLTLVWTDSAGGVGGSYNVVNDLDLSMTTADGTAHWNGNQLASGYSILNSSNRDMVNNVEQVIVPAGTFLSGAGIIAAVDPRTVMAPGQDFALFIDNATEPATSLSTVTPCRVVDTRNPNGPYGGPAIGPPPAVRTFAMTGGSCGIPISAKAVALNVTVTGSTSTGTIKMYPGGVVAPVAGVNYFSAGQTRANNSIVALGANGAMAVSQSPLDTGSVHVIIDVNGYFE
jgi:hypothetical protein